MTGRLTIHYRSPTPLHTELSLRGWLERADGRKIVCKGTLYAGDTLCAEAEGLFITVDFSKLEQMMVARDAAFERRE
jgi:acyl-CoA thioesterase FadM